MKPIRSPSSSTYWSSLRGRITPQASLASLTWFQVGGKADLLYRPADFEDLSFYLQNNEDHFPITYLGAASNVLLREGRLPGVVIKLGRGFSDVTFFENHIEVGAAALDRTVANMAAEREVSGLEFLSGIPGTIGGAIKMNAGCFGREIKDVFLWAKVLDENGRVHQLSPEDLGFSYRKSLLPEGWCVVSCALKKEQGDLQQIESNMQGIALQRGKSQPTKGRTGGSTFKNPLPEVSSYKAWELIDRAGCRGLQRGEALVSEKHCNFLMNLGGATASDLELLGEEVRNRVFQQTGVLLEWEVLRMGQMNKEEEEKA